MWIGDKPNVDDVSENDIKQIEEYDSAIDNILKQENLDFREGYHCGKKELIDVMNQAISIFWEVWKNNPAFKAHIMKEIYFACNKK